MYSLPVLFPPTLLTFRIFPLLVEGSAHCSFARRLCRANDAVKSVLPWSPTIKFRSKPSGAFFATTFGRRKRVGFSTRLQRNKLGDKCARSSLVNHITSSGKTCSIGGGGSRRRRPVRESTRSWRGSCGAFGI